jgi:glucokinase
LADIGGTNARFAHFSNGELESVATLRVANFPAPVEAIRAYLSGEGRDHRPNAAVVAGAGPVVNGTIALTNARWVIDGSEIQAALRLRSVQVVNDFAALAASVPALGPSATRPIGGGSALAGAPLAVIGPGTGFGVAALMPSPREDIVLATEGGHASLAGNNEREDGILETLRSQHGHASIERALSGEGLAYLCRTVAALDRLEVPPRSAAEVVEHALAGDCAASSSALEIFCALLGSAAGDIALILGARGGVFIGGGMVPRFAEFLERSQFRARFEGKGRLATYVAAIPTCIITHPHPALLGLARLARKAAPRARLA